MFILVFPTQKSTPLHNSNHNFINENTHGIIQQQQQHLTTTTFNHEFIGNYNNNIIFHQFEQKQQRFHMNIFQHVKLTTKTSLTSKSHTQT